MPTNLIKAEERIKILELQVKELQEAHVKLSAHYHEFVRATVEYLKESDEE